MAKEIMLDEDFSILLETMRRPGTYAIPGNIKTMLGSTTFTNMQMATLCKTVEWFCTEFVIAIIKRPELTTEHIDLIIQYGLVADVESVLSHCQKLTVTHIGVCLNWYNTRVCQLAYDHPLCTDAMRVAHNLKLGTV